VRARAAARRRTASCPLRNAAAAARTKCGVRRR
jgi:hypothetical protein